MATQRGTHVQRQEIAGSRLQENITAAQAEGIEGGLDSLLQNYADADYLARTGTASSSAPAAAKGSAATGGGSAGGSGDMNFHVFHGFEAKTKLKALKSLRTLVVDRLSAKGIESQTVEASS